MNYTVVYSDELSHHGILGMKWGIRRYQNEDGSLTDAGRKHYGRNESIRELKKNMEDAKTYQEKKAVITGNRVNRSNRLKLEKKAVEIGGAVTTGAATATTALAALSGLVNPLVPVGVALGGAVATKAINAGQSAVNAYRTVRVYQIERKLDKTYIDNKQSSKNESLSEEAEKRLQATKTTLEDLGASKKQIDKLSSLMEKQMQSNPPLTGKEADDQMAKYYELLTDEQKRQLKQFGKMAF